MCLAVFLASDHELDAVAWSADAPAFNVGPISEREEPVRAQFTRRRIYYMGSHTQCGCGFSVNGEEDPARRLEPVAALAAYATAALERGPVELYVCWEGEFALEPRRRLTLRVDELTQRDDWLEERSYVQLIP